MHSTTVPFRPFALSRSTLDLGCLCHGEQVGNAVIKRLDVSSNLADAPIYLPRLVELLELCTRCPDFSSAVQMYQQFSPPEMATRFHVSFEFRDAVHPRYAHQNLEPAC